MNVHSPERQADESRAQYRSRRANSARIIKTATKGPTQSPAVNKFDVSRFFLGQHTNEQRRAHRARIALVGKRQLKRMTMRALKA